MNRRSLSSKSHLGLVITALALAACDEAAPRPEVAPQVEPEAAPLLCELPQRGVVALAASRAGVVLAMSTPEGLVLQRASRSGCELSPWGAPIASDGLFDVDDQGNVFTVAAEASGDGVVSTVLADEYPGSMLARVDPSDRVVKVLPAGRGIWEFGVAPAGDAVWVSACGPTGIFALDEQGAAPSLSTPDTWDGEHGTLTDSSAFWSLGPTACEPGAPETAACGPTLVLTTGDGTSDLGPAIFDLGDGPMRPSLRRSGDALSASYGAGIVRFASDGSVAETLDREALGLDEAEHIVDFAWDDEGVYVLAQGDGETRVVFTSR
ncbi:MAG: hypothetical protein U0271_10155 [Polyangiaceae bacterium]